jgi:hypothetical protein
MWCFWHMKMAVFWVVAPCSLVEVFRHFRGATTQKTAVFILTTVRAWNPTFWHTFLCITNEVCGVKKKTHLSCDISLSKLVRKQFIYWLCKISLLWKLELQGSCVSFRTSVSSCSDRGIWKDWYRMLKNRCLKSCVSVFCDAAIQLSFRQI